ncbi:hypothetical protein ACFQ3Z_04515 [Streptomyces nogalater]
MELARTLALAGGDALVHARRDRLAAVRAAERTGDIALTARVIGAYDVPALWSRADDPGQSRRRHGGRAYARRPRHRRPRRTARPPAGRHRGREPQRRSVRHRAEARRAGGARGRGAGRELGDPALLVFALNGVFLQSFTRPGLAAAREVTGAEILDLATRHALPNFAVLGRLIRLQSASALGDLDAATAHARAAEQLAVSTEASLVPVLTGWFQARATAARSAEPGGPTAATAAAHYRAAENALAGTAGCRGCTGACSPSPFWACVSSTTGPRPPIPPSTGARTSPGPVLWCCSPATVSRRPVPRWPRRPNRPSTTCRRHSGA